jgi:hypothetical protein
MRTKDQIIVAPPSLDELLCTTPEWAKPVVVAAFEVHHATLVTRRSLNLGKCSAGKGSLSWPSR